MANSQNSNIALRSATAKLIERKDMQGLPDILFGLVAITKIIDFGAHGGWNAPVSIE